MIHFAITLASSPWLIIIATFMSSERAGMLESNVGILRAEWKGTDNRIEVVCFGTAFAISPHIIITCAHSIYLERQARPCSSFTFVPGIAQGKVTSTSMIYKCTTLNFLQFEPLQGDHNYIRQPIEQDIALLFLERPLNLPKYPRVGIEDQALIDKDNEVSIAGYPSQQFLKCANIFDAVFERVALKGKMLQIDGSIIYHNLNTSLGHSGSPILAYNIHQEPVILGIHTHKGSNRNSGVFLTPKILKRLIRYQINFALQHDRYRLAINFPSSLRRQALEQLDTSTIERIPSFQSYCNQSIESQQQIEQAHIKNEVLPQGSGRKSDEMNVQIERIDSLLAMSQKCLSQLKDGRTLNQIIDCYLRINDIMFSQLRCLLNDQVVSQGIYPPQYSSFFKSVEEGLQREMIQFRSLGDQLQIGKISSVQDHMRKLYGSEQMKQTRGEVIEREIYHDYDVCSEQYLRIITWPAQKSIQSMQQDYIEQAQSIQEGPIPHLEMVIQVPFQSCQSFNIALSSNDHPYSANELSPPSAGKLQTSLCSFYNHLNKFYLFQMNVLKRFMTFDTQRLNDLLQQGHLNNDEQGQLREEISAYILLGTSLRMYLRQAYNQSIDMEQLASKKECEVLAMKVEVANFAQVLSQNLFTSELKLIATIDTLKETQEALQIQEIHQKSPEEKQEKVQNIFDGLVKSFESFVKSRKESAQSIDEIIKKTIYLVETMMNDHRGLVASARWATGIDNGQKSEHQTIFNQVDRQNKERFDQIQQRLIQFRRKKKKVAAC